MKKILILDHDFFLLSSLQNLLHKRGYAVNCTQSIRNAERLLKNYHYDLFLLERILPDGNSLELLERIKERHLFLRTLVISQKKSLVDRIEVLKLADDFLAKPVNLTELFLKIENLVRLQKLGDQNFLENNGFLLKEENYIDADKLKLRPQELKILECLVQHKNMVISYDTITSYVWGYKDFLPIRKTISVYIRRIRSKLTRANLKIITYKNRGYKLSDRLETNN